MEKSRGEKQKPFEFDKAFEEEASPHPHQVHAVGFDDKKLKRRFHSKRHIFRTKKFWLWVLILLLVAAAAGWFVKPVRYWALNRVGMQGGLVVAVTDAKTQSGIPGVEVELDGKRYLTTRDKNSKRASVVIRDARFGQHTLRLHKNGYEDKTTSVIVREFAGKVTSDSPLVETTLVPKGLPVKVKAVNWLSGKVVEGATAEFATITAITDKDGLATLNIPPTDQKEVEVKITADGYHAQTAKLKVGEGAGDQVVKLVAAPKHFFLSKRTGKLGIYSSNLDGSNVQLLVAGTGKEAEDRTKFEVSPDNKTAALISTREGIRNSQGVVLEQLFIVDLEKATLTKIDESSDMEIIAWLDNSLAYTKRVGSLEDGYTEIMSYAVLAKEKRTLAQASYFNSILAGRGKIFFAASSVEGKELNLKNSQPSLVSITPDDKQKIIIDAAKVWNVARTDFSVLTYYTSDGKWREFNLDTNTKKDLPGAPAEQKVMVFAQSNDTTQIAWVDKRDGKDVLLVRPAAPGSVDRELYQSNGISQPIRWIGDKLVIFRVKNDRETADYIISTEGGAPQKISDVSSSGGFNQGSYN